MMKLWMKALVAAMLVVPTGCAQVLTGGIVAGQALLPISEQQEIAIGRSATQEILLTEKRYVNAGLEGYVRGIGQTMVAQSERKELPFEFYILDNPQLNAFALPGGFIFITTGALKAMNNEAELAAVLGHEVAHVAQRHGLEQLKRAMVAQGIAIAALGSSPQLVQAAGKIALQIVLNGYGRDAEFEADRFGTTYAGRPGYLPSALGSFLQTIAARHGETPAWLVPLSSHPPVSERVQHIQHIIAEQGLSGTRTDAELFLRQTAVLR